MSTLTFNTTIGFSGNLIRCTITGEIEILNFVRVLINDIEYYWLTIIPNSFLIPNIEKIYICDVEELIKDKFLFDISTLNVLANQITEVNGALLKLKVGYYSGGYPHFGEIYCIDAWKDEAEFGSFDFYTFYIQEKNYLCNLPQVNDICVDMPQFIHILIDTIDYAITQNIVVNYTDGTNDSTSFSYAAQGLHKILQFSCGYTQLNLESLNTENKTVYSYTVKLSGIYDNGMDPKQIFEWKTLTFMLKDKPLNSIVFCFKNAFGVAQFFMASGNLAEKKLSIKKDINEKPRDVAVNKLTGRYLGKIREKKNTFTVSSGYLSREEMICFEEMLLSENVYVLESNNSFTKIEIGEAEYKILEKDEEYNAVVFEYVK